MLRRTFFQALAVFGIPVVGVAKQEDYFKNEYFEIQGNSLIVRDKNKISYYKIIDGCHKLHREDGPAIEYINGDKVWYKNGVWNREDGPAIEYVNGNKSWYQDGKLHRLDGPAVENFTGDLEGYKAWYQHGKLQKSNIYQIWQENKENNKC